MRGRGQVGGDQEDLILLDLVAILAGQDRARDRAAGIDRERLLSGERIARHALEPVAQREGALGAAGQRRARIRRRRSADRPSGPVPVTAQVTSNGAAARGSPSATIGWLKRTVKRSIEPSPMPGVATTTCGRIVAERGDRRERQGQQRDTDRELHSIPPPIGFGEHDDTLSRSTSRSPAGFACENRLLDRGSLNAAEAKSDWRIGGSLLGVYHCSGRRASRAKPCYPGLYRLSDRRRRRLGARRGLLAWARLRRRPEMRVADLSPAVRAGRIAIFVAAWDESAVIGAMLRDALARFGYADLPALCRRLSQRSRDDRRGGRRRANATRGCGW